MAVSMFIAANSTVKLNFPIVKKVEKMPIESFRGFYKPVRCFPVEQQTGYLLCSKCKVFKCVTFPNDEDGEVLSF
uniref:Uncharacterized protein n=1 Tax=Solanum tuberosum TaxID=4113 RepID=M1CW54_SOLTU